MVRGIPAEVVKIIYGRASRLSEVVFDTGLGTVWQTSKWILRHGRDHDGSRNSILQLHFVRLCNYYWRWRVMTIGAGLYALFSLTPWQG